MGKTLISEVTAQIESDMDGASGALVYEYRRLEQLYYDIKGIRPIATEAAGESRLTAIHGLFFGGVLGKAFNEIENTSGVMAALISLAGGLTGTLLDRVFLYLLENAAGLWDTIKETGNKIEKRMADDWLQDPFVPFKWTRLTDDGMEVEYSLVKPAARSTEKKEWKVPTEPPKAGKEEVERHNIDLEYTIHRIKDMRAWLSKDETLKMLYGKIEEIHDLEDIMMKDPAHTMANFWVDAITKTEGWKKLTGGT